MKKGTIFLILLLLFTSISLHSSKRINNLKNIYFFNSIGNYEEGLKYLDSINIKNINLEQQKVIVDHLLRIGDSLLKRGHSNYAEKYYRKIIKEFPKYWDIYNKYEIIEREKGKKLITLDYVFKQLTLILKNFETIFIMFSIIIDSFFIASISVLYIVGLLLFIKYFKLFFNDFFFTDKGKIIYYRIIILLALILWPVFFKISWIIYPFILTGTVLGYMQKKEKKIAIIVGGIFLISTFGYNINLLLEERINNRNFKKVQMVYNKKKFSDDEIEHFNEELKIIQAYMFYKNQEYNDALNVLNMSNDSYTSKLKYDLLGCINYKFNNLNESLNYFNKSLEIDDRDQKILNNLALILLKDSDREVYESYELRFPKIKELRNNVSFLEEPKLNKKYFWESLLNLTPNTSFKAIRTFKTIILNYLKIPIIYFIFIAFLYYFIFRTLSDKYSDSINCSKCHKILKKSKIHRSYDICDDCYQLFFIKDMIFLEAKAIKTRELEKKSKKRLIYSLLISFLIPGYNFYTKQKYLLFTLCLLTFTFFTTVTIWSNFIFKKLFLLMPLIINVFGILALFVYLIINLISLIGEKDGI